MFNGSSNLKTIYVSNLWTTAAVTSSQYMFSGCTSLVGGNGTKYKGSDIIYARVDVDGTPGYLTLKSN